METNHTPGPWSVDDYGDVQANGEDVARIATCERAAADAALIAAAPDLLSALQGLLEKLPDREPYARTQFQLARVAIANAIHAPANNQIQRAP